MSSILYPDFFNDVFGPIMQPGSSGGFAGPTRISNVARKTIDGDVKKVVFSFQKDEEDHFKSIANFMTDRGFLGGIQGFDTEDVRLFEAFPLAKKSGLDYQFILDQTNYENERAVKIEVWSESEYGEIKAASVGGGMIRVYEINGYPVDWQADTYGLLVAPFYSIDTQKYEAFIEKYKDNIVETSEVKNNNQEGKFIELDKNLDKEELDSYFEKKNYVFLPAVLPIVTTNKKQGQLFKTIDEWRSVAKERGISFLQAAIEYEKASSGWSDDQIWGYFRRIADIFDKQIHSLEDRDYVAEDTKLLPVYGKKWNEFRKKQKTLSDPLTAHILTHAYATNAKLPGVLIVPGPMGTGGGYLYSALDAVREDRGYSKEKEIEGLVIAATLGALAYTHTNASGERGCIGESGVCNAMAAGAIAWMTSSEDDPVTADIAVERAASMALQANMGLVCDPIPGGLEFPCLTRTFRAAVTAPMYAEMARIGIDPLVPYHECLQAMERHYQNTPAHQLCGGNCGICTTPTAERCKKYLEEITEAF